MKSSGGYSALTPVTPGWTPLLTIVQKKAFGPSPLFLLKTIHQIVQRPLPLPNTTNRATHPCSSLEPDPRERLRPGPQIRGRPSVHQTARHAFATIALATGRDVRAIARGIFTYPNPGSHLNNGKCTEFHLSSICFSGCPEPCGRASVATVASTTTGRGAVPKRAIRASWVIAEPRPRTLGAQMNGSPRIRAP